MSESAEPAMPPEEWAAQLKRTPEQRRERLLWAKGEADAYGYLTIHGLAALALYGQPFGFTREDVALLNNSGVRAGLIDSGDVEGLERLIAITAKIAALLPPAAPG